MNLFGGIACLLRQLRSNGSDRLSEQRLHIPPLAAARSGEDLPRYPLAPELTGDSEDDVVDGGKGTLCVCVCDRDAVRSDRDVI